MDRICPLTIKETFGINRQHETVSTGIPFPKSLVHQINTLHLVDNEANTIPCQLVPLELWPDRSVKWALLYFSVNIEAYKETEYFFTITETSEEDIVPPFSVSFCESENDIQLATDCYDFTISTITDKPGEAIITRKTSNNSYLSQQIEFVWETDKGETLSFFTTKVTIEETGSLCTKIVNEGIFRDSNKKRIAKAAIRYVLWATSPIVQADILVHNPQAAQHPGGIWDLGDKGSIYFNDLTLRISCPENNSRLTWKTKPSAEIQSGQYSSFIIHQNSSGGRNWNSPNHVNCKGEKTVSYKGFKVTANNGTQELAAGDRATPYVQISGEKLSVAAAIQNFWQEFPKSIRYQNSSLQLSLFPKEQETPFELQGGERKRHTVFLEFGEKDSPSILEQVLNPVHITLSPKWIEHTTAFPYFPAGYTSQKTRQQEYVNAIINGEHSFFAKREIIDEYGWRNFGDQYADHEAVNHSGPDIFISHYNNQYDFILGACSHYLLSGDNRWAELMSQQARHTMDIDIYHTEYDKACYNKGYFWHTDHYRNAYTSTHRTYSKGAFADGADKKTYGGGPSNEQDYSSGLLHFYYLTGDREARETVINLADWVIAMDDGSQNILGILDEGPTGAATQTVDVNFHHPGRGAGNSINTLIDAYRLTGERAYLSKAEEIITRCIHPADAVEDLGLDEPEFRWSYLVFLQVLGKYLDYKMELDESDYFFHYGRESLVHYARWMQTNEKPYKSVLHKVLIPTETWPAHDIRKCHIFWLAAKYGQPEEFENFREKAEFFYSTGFEDLLSFETAYLTRPLVIFAVYGHIHNYFTKLSEPLKLPDHNYNFGQPAVFVPQRLRIKQALQAKRKIIQSFFLNKLGW